MPECAAALPYSMIQNLQIFVFLGAVEVPGRGCSNHVEVGLQIWNMGELGRGALCEDASLQCMESRRAAVNNLQRRS